MTINKTYKKIESYTDIIFDTDKVEKIYKKNENISKEDDIIIPDDIKERMKLFGIIAPGTKDSSNQFSIEEDYIKILDLEKRMNEKRSKLIDLKRELSSTSSRSERVR